MGLELTFDAEAIRRAVREPATALLDRVGREALEIMLQLVPVDTGKLRDSLGYTFRQDTAQVTWHADMFYAPYVEYGTYRTAARPFMRPALDRVPAIIAAIGHGT